MKSFTDIFIRRPVLAIVVNLVILIAGFQAGLHGNVIPPGRTGADELGPHHQAAG